MTTGIQTPEIANAADNRPQVVPLPDPQVVSPVRRYVAHALRDLLGRAAVAAEVEGWTRQLDSGVSRATLASCLLNSTERRDRWVTRMYERFLKRAPNHEMLRYWSEQLASRRSQEEVLSGILSSPEYLEMNGQRHDQFVRALYRDLSSERPSNEDVDAWVGLLDSASASRTCIAHLFVTTDEFRRRMIREWYLNYLDREPDREAIAYSLEQLKIGHSAERVQAEILATREYYQRTLRLSRAS